MHPSTNYLLGASIILLQAFASNAFVSTAPKAFVIAPSSTINKETSSSSSALNFFGKVFEEDGPLGKGITVAKVQIALQSRDRGSSSIFGEIERKANNAGSTSYDLAVLANEVCLTLLRRSDDWVGACSSSEWFGEKDAGKAERTFNDLANKEAVKYEKEYIPGPSSEEKGGGPTLAVVSLVIELQGDVTEFDGAGYNFGDTKEILSSIASDVMVEEGDCVNAVEVFWTPGEKDEVLTNHDLIIDFPEIITL